MPKAKPLPNRPRKGADSPEEFQRFLETAREVEASDDPKDFDRAFKKIVSKGRK